MNNKELWFFPSENLFSFREKIKLQMWRYVEMFFFRTSWHGFSKWRVFLLRLFGAKIGNGCYISSKAKITVPWNFVLGNYSSIDCFAVINSDYKVHIGDYCSLANYVQIITGGHDATTRSLDLVSGPVIIKDGVFIGANSFISYGVVLETMCVIGSFSYVCRSMPENMVCVGHPCRPVKPRLDAETYEKYRYNYVTLKN